MTSWFEVHGWYTMNPAENAAPQGMLVSEMHAITIRDMRPDKEHANTRVNTEIVFTQTAFYVIETFETIEQMLQFLPVQRVG